MESYLIFIIIGAIFIIVMTSPYFNWQAKSLVVIYYAFVKFLFIGNTRRINAKYDGIIPVPDAYWDENSAWAFTASNLLLVPFIGILIFIYYQWFAHIQTLWAKILIAISLLPAALLVFIFYFFFNLEYGYRP